MSSESKEFAPDKYKEAAIEALLGATNFVVITETDITGSTHTNDSGDITRQYLLQYRGQLTALGLIEWAKNDILQTYNKQ